MHYLYLLFITIILASCSNINNVRKVQTKEKKYADSKQIRIHKKKYILTNSTYFYIENKKLYSQTFIEDFISKHSVYDTVALQNDTIIINNDRANIVRIPTLLPLNKEVIYENTSENTNYTLQIKRINISSIAYQYYETQNGKKQKVQQGTAVIQSNFYLGSEATFEDEQNETHGMNAYITRSKNQCSTYIYIGTSNISKSFIKFNCNTENSTIYSPLLILK